MADNNSRLAQVLYEKHGVTRPSVTRLLVHIFSSIFGRGMISLLILGSAIIALLHNYDIPSSKPFALLIGTIVVLGFLRGCKAWQEDLNEYQKSLANALRTYPAYLRQG